MLNYNVLNRYVELLKKNRMTVISTTDNIKELTTADINKLKAGDIVLKNDSTGKHAYIVTYKKNGTGICLTYVDASVAETVSYDYNAVTKEWVYNSTDITPLEGAQYTAGNNITIEHGVISATDTTYTGGTGITISEENVISLSETPKHLYRHKIYMRKSSTGEVVEFEALSPNSTPWTARSIPDSDKIIISSVIYSDDFSQYTNYCLLSFDKLKSSFAQSDSPMMLVMNYDTYAITKLSYFEYANDIFADNVVEVI